VLLLLLLPLLCSARTQLLPSLLDRRRHPLCLFAGEESDVQTLTSLHDFERAHPLIAVFVDVYDPRFKARLVRACVCVCVPHACSGCISLIVSHARTGPVRDACVQVPFHRFRAAWSAAALGIAFVRAHVGHPFARSVVPLIPTVIALTDRAVEGTCVFDKKCGVLLSSAFAKAHFAAPPASASSVSTPSAAAAPLGSERVGAAAAASADGDADGDVTMNQSRAGGKRKR
jgi:hypothetical protein